MLQKMTDASTMYNRYLEELRAEAFAPSQVITSPTITEIAPA